MVNQLPIPDKSLSKMPEMSIKKNATTQPVKCTKTLYDKKPLVQTAKTMASKAPKRSKPKDGKKVIQLKTKVLKDLFSVHKPKSSKNWQKINKLKPNRQTVLIEELKHVGTFEPSVKLRNVLKTQGIVQ
jgi:hypothetical protein